MASISREPNGRRTIQFVGSDGKRRSIRLGKVNQRSAEMVRTRVECLVASGITGAPVDDEISRWLAGLDQAMSDKLAGVGLIPRRQSATLAMFLDNYFASRLDVKPTTLATWRQVGGSLVATFGPDRPLRSIDATAAEHFRTQLLASSLAPTTVQKRLQGAREFFNVARRRGLIAGNPFAEIKAVAVPDPQRARFVTREETQSVLDACPDCEWRAIVALCRFGGLRCPSEVLSLRWLDIDWERGRIAVQSPKGERHGKGVRAVPLFPELRPYLEEAFDQAPPGAIYVIHRNRKPQEKRIDGRSCNYRTRFAKIVARAGLTPWPRIFQNLRASRQTELAADHPIHVVTAWLGNTPKIAMRHYLMTTEADFAKAVRNPVQQTAASPGNAPQEALTAHQGRNPYFQATQQVATRCEKTLEKMAEVNGNRTHPGPLRALHWF